MKKSLRVLSLVLSVVMIFSCVSVGASAASYKGTADDAKSITYDDVNSAVYSTDQYAEMALDEVNRMLEEANLGVLDVFVGKLDLSNVDNALAGVVSLVSGLSSLKDNLGDAVVLFTSVEKLKVSGSAIQRKDGDLEVIYALLDFIASIAPVAQKYVKGTVNLGLVQSFVSNYIFDVRQLAMGLLVQLTGLADTTTGTGDDAVTTKFEYMSATDSEKEAAGLGKDGTYYKAGGTLTLAQDILNKYVLGSWEKLDGKFYEEGNKKSVISYNEILWIDSNGNDVSGDAMDTATYDYYGWVHPDSWVTKGLGDGVRVASGAAAPSPSYTKVNLSKMGDSYDFVEALFLQAYNGILVPVLERITTRWINEERGWTIDESKTEQYITEADGTVVENEDFDYMYLGDKPEGDTTASSVVFTLFDDAISIPKYTIESGHTFVEDFNNNLGKFVASVLKVKASEDSPKAGDTVTYTFLASDGVSAYKNSEDIECKFTWKYGSNSANLVNNVCSTLKFLLHVTEKEFFDNGIIERGEYKTGTLVDKLTNQQLLAYVLRGVINANIPYMYIPETPNTQTLAGVALEACIQLANQDLPQITYTSINAENYTGELEYAKAVVEKGLTILMDVAAYNLNSVLDTNLNATGTGTDNKVGTNTTGLLGYLGDSGDWRTTATTIAAWAVYTWASGRTGNSLLNLAFKSDDYEGKSTSLTMDDVWKDLDLLVNNIVPIDSDNTSTSSPDNRPWLNAEISGTSANNGNVIQTLLFDYIIYPILTLDVTNLEKVLSKNANGALANDTIETVLVDTVHRIFDLIFPEVFAHKVTSIDTFLDNDTLGNMVSDLVSTLAANGSVTGQANGGTIAGRGKIIAGVALPIVCLALGLSDKQEFKELENYLPTVVAANADGITFQVHNGSSGVNTSYRTTDGTYSRAYDNLYSYNITSATATVINAEGKTGTITGVAKGTTLNGGDTKEATLSGVSAGDMVEVKYEYQVLTEDGTALNDGKSLSSVTYCYVGTTDTGDDEDLVSDTIGGCEVQYTTDVYLGSGDSVSNLDNYTVRIKTPSSASKNSPIAASVTSVQSQGQGWLSASSKAESMDAADATYVLNPIKTDSQYKRTEYEYSKDTDGNTEVDAYDKPVKASVKTGKYVTDGTYPISVTLNIGGESKTITVRAHFYDDYGLESLVNSCISANLSQSDLTTAGSSYWNSYYTALKNAASFVLKPNLNGSTFDTYIGLSNAGTINETSQYKTLYEALYAAKKNVDENKASSGAAALWTAVNLYLPYNYTRDYYTATNSAGEEVTVFYQKPIEYSDSSYQYVGMRNYVSYSYREFKSYVKHANSLIDREYKWVSKTADDYAAMTAAEKKKFQEDVDKYQEDVEENTGTISTIESAYAIHMLNLTHKRLIAFVDTDAYAAKLKTIIAQYGGKDKTGYSTTTFANYKTAYDFANSVAEKGAQANPEMVTRAITELINAWKHLAGAADYTKLKAAYDSALASEDDFNYGSWLSGYSDYTNDDVTYITYDAIADPVGVGNTDNKYYQSAYDTSVAYIDALNTAIKLLKEQAKGKELSTADQDTIDEAAAKISTTQEAAITAIGKYLEEENGGGDGGNTGNFTVTLDTTTTYSGNGATYTAAINETIFNTVDVSTIENNGTTYTLSGVIYGVPQKLTEEVAKSMFTVTGGTVEVTKNSKGNYGTGSLIIIKDSSGTVKNTYFVAYRGDATLDGSIDSNDKSAMSMGIVAKEGYAYSDKTSTNSARYIMPAVDITGDGMFDSNDYASIGKVISSGYGINQTSGGIVSQ